MIWSSGLMEAPIVHLISSFPNSKLFSEFSGNSSFQEFCLKTPKFLDAAGHFNRWLSSHPSRTISKLFIWISESGFLGAVMIIVFAVQPLVRRAYYILLASGPLTVGRVWLSNGYLVGLGCLKPLPFGPPEQDLRFLHYKVHHVREWTVVSYN
ncbi:hypothetical protein L218DRAFT_243241 [Marasmius fiardii PR-910]|nr:hypothetical protein L218DRAFT_243241 [Marasmius fiardii PR-910]